MRQHNYIEDNHDAFGWLKTLGLIVVMFALMIGSSILAAKADQCADSCRARNNECRIQTKGSPSCDAQQNACLQACIATLSKSKKN